MVQRIQFSTREFTRPCSAGTSIVEAPQAHTFMNLTWLSDTRPHQSCSRSCITILGRQGKFSTQAAPLNPVQDLLHAIVVPSDNEMAALQELFRDFDGEVRHSVLKLCSFILPPPSPRKTLIRAHSTSPVDQVISG